MTRFVLAPSGPWACRERFSDRFDTDVGGTRIVVEGSSQSAHHQQSLVERTPVIIDWSDGARNYTLEEAEQHGGELLEPAKRLRERISLFATLRSETAR